MSVSDQYAQAKGTAMADTKITVAALRSVLRDPSENLALLRSTAERAKADGARMLFAPELMLTGHGGHPQMADNAEPVPDGPLAQAVLAMSAEEVDVIASIFVPLGVGVIVLGVLASQFENLIDKLNGGK